MKHPVTMSQRALPPRDGVLPLWPGEQVDRLFVRRGPAQGGEPALMVHGLGGSSANWTDLVGVLAGTVEAEVLDLPGFGRSEPPADGRYTVGAHARAVVRHLEQSGRGPVHLFGNSLGGAVSTRVAADRPDLVRTLTLVSPALPNLRPQRGSDPRLPLLLLPGLRSLASRQMARRTPEERARRVLALCFADLSAAHPDRIAQAVDGPEALWARAARVAAPTLLVWGAQDRLVDVAIAPRAAATFPDARLLVLDRVGHVAQMERPELVARAFLGMLEQIEARPAA